MRANTIDTVKLGDVLNVRAGYGETDPMLNVIVVNKERGRFPRLIVRDTAGYLHRVNPADTYSAEAAV